MNYNNFCDELQNRINDQVPNDDMVKYLFLNKGYRPTDGEMELIVQSANIRLTNNDFRKYLLEDFLIIVVNCYGVKIISYLPMQGLFYEFEEHGWNHILHTIRDVTKTMKKNFL